ncbi:uncharacterized protein P884DRAFT_270388 [Thermothelomyces heterothallicus CBS 202.75]|uniref:uncharacterized protein n=1 Tax=Thermothelomyces heterothallicus CBS 202.75 TaxID=1149848 RepID=UPI0037432C4D
MTNGVILALAGFGAGARRQPRPPPWRGAQPGHLPRGAPERADRRPVRGRDAVRKVDSVLRNGWGGEMHPRWRHGIEAVQLRIAPEAARTKGLVDQLRFKKEAWDEFLAKN